MNLQRKSAFKNQDLLVKVDLPNSDLIFGCGIASLSLSFLTGIPGIILGIVAIYLFKKPNSLYLLAPELYFESSYRNIKVGRVLAIIGLILSSLVFLVFLILFFILTGFYKLVT